MGDVTKALNYWISRGKRYKEDFLRSPAFEQQEEALLTVLDELRPHSILEVGCGFGRITALSLGRYDFDHYTAIDVSEDQLAWVDQDFPEVETIQASILDFETSRRWDMVLAAEVMMHIPPSSIQVALDRMRALAIRYVVTVDYTGPSRGLSAHNWSHDYASLLPDATITPIGNRQSIIVVRL